MMRTKTASLVLLTALALSLRNTGATDYRRHTLEAAHDMFRAATNSSMYAAAARQYEYLVQEENVRNGNLFYTLGNCWFMAGDVGRAVLNYRRAERYLPNDRDLRYNLEAALALRTDLVPVKELSPAVATLLGWHFKTSSMLRGWLFAFGWILFWGALLWAGRTKRREARITAVTAGALSLVLLSSLLAEALFDRRADPGVIVAREVLARKGDGERYAPAFLDPLHTGTEFRLLEERGSWWFVRLDDGQFCWIPSNSVELVAIR